MSSTCTRRAARVRARAGSRAPCRASASGPTSTAWPRELELGGYVLNDSRGVLVEVEGSPAGVDAFLARLAAEAPPLAAVERVACEQLSADRRARLQDRRRARAPGEPDARSRSRRRDLRRLPRRALRSGGSPVPLPVHQLHELRAALHDRPRRSVRPAADDDGGLRACAPTACASTTTPATGASTPSRTPVPRAGRARGCSTARGRAVQGDPVAAAARAIAAGAIVAVKGIGGYHLACDATNERRWRSFARRKHREDRPFALMVRRISRPRMSWSSSGPRRRRCCARPRAADRARAAPPGRRAWPPA